MEEKNNEQETDEKVESESSDEAKDAGVQLPPDSIINRAEEVKNKLQTLVRQDRENLDRREALMVSDRLGGTTEAGQGQSKQFTPEEKASRARIKAIADASGSSWGERYG